MPYLEYKVGNSREVEEMVVVYFMVSSWHSNLETGSRPRFALHLESEMTECL